MLLLPNLVTPLRCSTTIRGTLTGGKDPACGLSSAGFDETTNNRVFLPTTNRHGNPITKRDTNPTTNRVSDSLILTI